MDANLWCVVSYWRTQCFTGIYILSEWGFDYTQMNTIWQLWWCISYKSCGICSDLYHLLIAIFLSIHKSVTKDISESKLRVLLPLCERTEGQVRWKKEHILWILREHCRCSSLRGPCVPASTLSRMQALGSLLVWWTIFPPSQAGRWTFWPWCQQSQAGAAE